MNLRVLIVCGLLLLLFVPVTPAAEARVLTLWPAVDYRSDPPQDYSSLHLLGPLLKYEHTADTTRWALRPLFHHEDTAAGHLSSTDILYPLASANQGDDLTRFQLLRLLTLDFGVRESGSKNEFMLFPFIFYGHPPDRSPTFALFPLGGRIEGKYGRERIDFALFPLYSRTSTKELTTTNILWPFLSWVDGENVSGWQFWPFYGRTEKLGSFDKRFFLWPFFIRNDLGLGDIEPRRETVIFPFWASVESSSLQAQNLFWPFFSHTRDLEKGYEEWDFPWPLLRLTSGEGRDGIRVIPFYANERIGDFRKRWFLWPLYKIEERQTESFSYRRDRIAFFLYSDLEERLLNEELPHKKRVALWPLFTYENTDGLSSFSTLSLLEPFFPDNERIVRNWAPLWRIYQTRWDRRGNQASSLLWNLYWKETRGDDIFWELFPLVRYRHEDVAGVDLSLLKGLFRYRRDPERTKLTFLFLPWGPSWVTAPPRPAPPGVL